MTEATQATPVAQEPHAPVVPPAVPTPAPSAAPRQSQPETPPAPKADEKTFTQADIDRIVKERLDRAEKANADKLQKEQEAAEQKRLQEQGQFKELADKEKARADQLEATLKQRDYDALRAKVAADNNLPAAWAVRLVGDDETALTADAKELAKTLVPAAPVPGASPSPKPAGPAGGAGDEAAQAAQRRSILSSW